MHLYKKDAVHLLLKKTGILLILLLITAGFQGCDFDDDDSVNLYFETLPALDADFPESFEYGKIYRIHVTMERPTNCYYFRGFDFFRTGTIPTERTIFPIASVTDQEGCSVLTEPDNIIVDYFDFEVLYTETYVFKLYAGINENGEDEFLIWEVPVVTNAPGN